MTTSPALPDLMWITPSTRRPLCDVPWHGTSIVQANGEVNFCCYSNAVVGNVNDATFDEIWNGHVMQEIRHQLTDGTLPTVCHSTACPIFRGDVQHHILDRMEGRHSLDWMGVDETRRRIRQVLAGTVIDVRRTEGTGTGHASGGQITVFVDIAPYASFTPPASLTSPVSPAPILTADLFAGIRGPDGAIRFLPSSDEYPVPFETALALSGTDERLQVTVLDVPVDKLAAGDHELCIALFEADSNPNLRSNCYWASNVTVTP